MLRRGLTALGIGLLLSCGESPVDPPAPPDPPDPPPDPTLGFDIEVRYVEGTNPTAGQQAAVDSAVALWESVIVGDLPALEVSRPAGLCERVPAPAMEETVDDLVVWIQFAPIDGERGIGAWGGVCELRDSFLPAVGSALFDTADFPTFSKRRVVHELGHALGFGEVWNELGLLVDPSNPENGGPGFVPAAMDVTISSARPDENFGLPVAGEPLSDLLVTGGGMDIWTDGPPEEELRTLLWFDLSPYEFEVPISMARLIMHDSAAVGESRLVRVTALEEPWDETTVTWSTRPSGSQEPFVLLGIGDGCGGECIVGGGFETRDVVRAWLSGTAENHGFMLSIDFGGADPDYGAALQSRHHPNPDEWPRLYIGPTTHFAGPNAIAAYDAAGGADSQYPKVPVQSDFRQRGASVDGHWQSSIIRDDYMSPQEGALMSAITIGAMEDMGYEVDYSVADPLEVDTQFVEPTWLD